MTNDNGNDKMTMTNDHDHDHDHDKSRRKTRQGTPHKKKQNTEEHSLLLYSPEANTHTHIPVFKQTEQTQIPDCNGRETRPIQEPELPAAGGIAPLIPRRSNKPV